MTRSRIREAGSEEVYFFDRLIGLMESYGKQMAEEDLVQFQDLLDGEIRRRISSPSQRVRLTKRLMNIGGREESRIPQELSGDRAHRVMERLVRAGVLTPDWQPGATLKSSRKGILAHYLAVRFRIKDKWVAFSRLWQINRGTLRKYYNDSLAEDIRDYERWLERLADGSENV